MSLIKLFQESFIDIYQIPKTSRLHAEWKGHQSVQTVHQGCERILELLVQTGTGTVLNDNTHVQGTWKDAAQWLAHDWFPQMKQAGLQRLAWVYSPSKLSQISTDITLASMDAQAFGVKVFHSKSDAIVWLNQDAADTTDAQRPRPHVLVIEDNADFSEMFHSMLHIMGCIPELARTAASGLDLARHSIPDMIFCDIGLPGDMNGYDFANAVRSDALLKDIPLIAVSGYCSEQEREHALGAGFDRIFPKPVKFADISEALARFSHGSRLAFQ